MNSATGIATTWARPRWTSAAACAALCRNGPTSPATCTAIPTGTDAAPFSRPTPGCTCRSSCPASSWPIRPTGRSSTPTAIVPSDYFTIGNRYAVRGFDGQMTLASEDGWSLRNDLSLNLGDLGQQLYVGLDVGRVGGQSAQFLSGRTLVGSVAGLRGRGLARCCQCGQRQLRPVAGLAAQETRKPEDAAHRVRRVADVRVLA